MMIDIQWRRLLLVLALSIASVILFTPILGLVFDAPPRKTSHLLLQVSFLLGLVVTSRRSGSSWVEEAGLGTTMSPVKNWVGGFLAGVLTLSAYSGILLLIGERTFEPIRSIPEFSRDVLLNIPFSVTIGILEDIPFFGFLYVIFGRKVLPCAVFYSLSHFLHIDKASQFSDTAWLHGVEAISKMGQAWWADAPSKPMEVIGLVFVGLVLCLLRREGIIIWLAMGVHGGWFYVKKISSEIGDDVKGTDEWLYGSGVYYDGLLGWVTILITGYVALRFLKRSRGT